MKKKSVWRYIIISGMIGIIVGIFMDIFSENLPELLVYYIPYPIIYFFSKFTKCSEMGCAFYYVISLWLTYIILGILVGAILYKLRKNE